MRLWAAVYASIWIVFFEILLGMWPDPPAAVPYLHLLLGIAIVGVVYNSLRQLRASRVPGRVKRIANATFGLSIVMLVTGLLLWVDFGSGWNVPGLNFSVFRLVLIFHAVNALAIITQAAAAAIAYDMWEDHEFEKESLPGVIPPAPVPGKA